MLSHFLIELDEVKYGGYDFNCHINDILAYLKKYQQTIKIDSTYL